MMFGLRVSMRWRLLHAMTMALLSQTSAAAPPAPDVPLTKEAAAPCEAVATAARRVTPAAWAHEEAALAPTLRIEKQRGYAGSSAFASPGPRAREIAASPAAAAAIGASSGWTTFVEHVAGTDLYEALTFQGTLLEEGDAFIRARPGSALQIVPAPPSARGGEWTTSEDLGTVDGRPVIVDHGRNDPTAHDQDIQLTPWLGNGWGPACRVALTFASDYPVKERFCGDANVCAAAARIAGEVARAFDRHQLSDKTPFSFGPKASGEAQTMAARGQDTAATNDHPDFPEFGVETVGYSFGGDGATPFALVLNGRDYLALIGHDGVGWRTSTTILLAIYDPDGDTPKPLAGIVVRRTIAALDQARVLPPVLTPHQP